MNLESWQCAWYESLSKKKCRRSNVTKQTMVLRKLDQLDQLEQKREVLRVGVLGTPIVGTSDEIF